MTELPKVSLVVLNWNGFLHLAECLESLSQLDYPSDRLELILCDNGSTDGSVELVRQQFPDFVLITLDRNYGFAEGNNRAAELATGDWVGFLNNDMAVPQSWLRDLLVPLGDNPDIACLASRIMNWNETAIDFIGGGTNFQGHGLQLDYRERSSQNDKARRVLFACGGAMLIKRRLFLDVGGFDPSYFAFFEDVDLGWRLNLLGHDVWYTPLATVRHRHHGTASRFTAYQLKLLSERNALFTIFKNYDDANLNLVLPVALMLLNEKATMMAQVNVEAFRPSAMQAPPPVPHLERPRPRDPTIGNKVRRVIREEGVAGFLAKVRGWIRARIEGRLERVNPPTPSAFEPPLDTHIVPNVAVSHMVAISELARNMDTLLEKRRWLQSRRQRTDEEVLALGKVLLEDPTWPSPEYFDFHKWLCKVSGIDSRFDSVRL